MISRSRFFVASLWAALLPAAIMVVCATLIMLFPELHRLGDYILLKSGLVLIAMPFVYTAAVVASYGVGRVLYELRVLNRFTLIIMWGMLAMAGAWFMTWWAAANETVDIVREFALFLALGLVTAIGTAFIWWRVVSRVDPGSIEDEPHTRVRRRQRRGLFRRLANKW